MAAISGISAETWCHAVQDRRVRLISLPVKQCRDRCVRALVWRLWCECVCARVIVLSQALL